MTARRTSTTFNGAVQRNVAAVFCGVLIALPWLDERLYPAAWMGLTGLIFVTTDQQPHRAFRCWLLAGFSTMFTAMNWLPGVVADHLHVSIVTGAMASLLVAACDAFQFGLFGLLLAMLRPRRGASLLVWPVVWVALEWCWPHIFPWRMGHSQIGWLPFCQIAELTGVYGVSFLLVWGAACIAGLLRSWMFRTPELRNSLRGAVVCGIVLVGSVGWGGWRMQSVVRDGESVRRLRVALVQPGERQDSLESLQLLSRQVGDQSDLVVWGESSVGCFSSDLGSFQSSADVEGSARVVDGDLRPCPGLGCPLLCAGGSFTHGCRQTGPFQNTAFLVNDDESIIGQYHKRVLMPWGEYAVGQQWIPVLGDLLGNQDCVVAGASAAPLELPNETRLGVLVCYEDLCATSVRDTVQGGAHILVNLNNHAVFGNTPAITQHQQIARFRAIENRRVLLRGGLTGQSSAISPTGEVLQQASLRGAETLQVNTPLLTSRTLYTRFGDAFPIGCCIVAMVLLLRNSARDGQARRETTDGRPCRRSLLSRCRKPSIAVAGRSKAAMPTST